jgi:mannosyl-oligosaccharide alpha-1,2-mannosidase
MFQSIMRATETVLANSAVADVTVQGGTTKLDEMEVRHSLAQGSS